MNYGDINSNESAGLPQVPLSSFEMEFSYNPKSTQNGHKWSRTGVVCTGAGAALLILGVLGIIVIGSGDVAKAMNMADMAKSTFTAIVVSGSFGVGFMVTNVGLLMIYSRYANFTAAIKHNGSQSTSNPNEKNSNEIY